MRVEACLTEQDILDDPGRLEVAVQEHVGAVEGRFECTLRPTNQWWRLWWTSFSRARDVHGFRDGTRRPIFLSR